MRQKLYFSWSEDKAIALAFLHQICYYNVPFDNKIIMLINDKSEKKMF